MRRDVSDTTVYQRIYAIVSTIPYGKVATYGQIASIADRCNARMVGYALARVPGGSPVPWHRVINSKGTISRRSHGQPCEEQRYLLESEGIYFNAQGAIDLQRYRWNGYCVHQVMRPHWFPFENYGDMV